jgi:hypothetical protein
METMILKSTVNADIAMEWRKMFKIKMGNEVAKGRATTMTW